MAELMENTEQTTPVTQQTPAEQAPEKKPKKKLSRKARRRIVRLIILAVILGAAGFSCYWGIHELLAQEFRVLRGWFPENPARAEYYKRQREKYPDLTPTPSHKNLCRKRK